LSRYSRVRRIDIEVFGTATIEFRIDQTFQRTTSIGQAGLFDGVIERCLNGRRCNIRSMLPAEAVLLGRVLLLLVAVLLAAELLAECLQAGADVVLELIFVEHDLRVEGE